MRGHLRHQPVDRVGFPAGEHGLGHAVLDGVLQHLRSGAGDLTHDIALGHDAGDLAVVPGDDNATNATAAEQLGDVEQRHSRGRGHHVPALQLQNGGDVHSCFLQPGNLSPVDCDILSWTR